LTSGAVPEIPFRLEVAGDRIGSWTCSPEYLEALAVGWLVFEGYLQPGEPLPELEVVERDGALVRATPTATQIRRGEAERRHRAEHGCGALHLARCGTPLPLRRPPVVTPPIDAMPGLFRTLFAGADRYRETGGLHSAALSDGERVLYPTEEVSRHNAVDKVIGRALLDGVDPTGLGLVTSARISADIAAKAVRAGLSWVASRSVPTSLALEVAAAARLPIVARAPGREPRIHSPPASDAGSGVAS